MKLLVISLGGLLLLADIPLVLSNPTDWHLVLSVLVVAALLIGFGLRLREGDNHSVLDRWQPYTDADYEQTCKEILGEYTPQELAAQEQEERVHFNTKEAEIAFWAGATDYSDYDGRRRKL